MTKTNARRIVEDLEKPSLDDRSYRYVELPNKLQALLVHDPETDKASASMNVNVGSFSDDREMPGMAHAVEHLLFMGTEKYPVENEYSSYLSAHAGHSNAYTAPTQTNYYFECAASGEATKAIKESGNDASGVNGDADVSKGPFYGALDRFAQFFVKPLFLESTLDRELRAVDSENKKNLQSDQWRLSQLAKSLTNEKHPFSKFATGSLETLRDVPEKQGIKIREKFIEFYDQHYSANLMKLVVLGKEPLDVLESWVSELFTDVQNKDLKEDSWEGPEQPLTGVEIGTQIFAKPVMESRTLEIWFPYPNEEALSETQPSQFLSHLLGHEGPGSILAYIKEKGWANSLSCGSYNVCPGTAFFDFRIGLTLEGAQKYQEIITVVFQYISLMKEQPPIEWMFDESKTMSEVDFRFAQKSPASSFTRSTSVVMQKPIPREWLLSGSKLRRFDPEAIVKGLGYLRPDNFRMMLTDQNHKVDLTERERWYGTEYAVQNIPDDFIASLESAMTAKPQGRPDSLHLPHKNEFIPTRLDVEKKEVPVPAVAPKLLRNDQTVRLWWKKDDRFWVPKANVLVTIRSPLVYATPANSVKTSLFCALVKDSLSEFAYDAELSGLDYSLSDTSLGIDINLGGYNDKLPVLLEKLLTSMMELKVNPDRFKVIKERLSRGYKNWGFQQPYYQVGTYTKWLTQERAWINHEMIAELAVIEAQDIQDFLPQILSQVHLEILAHGNLHREEALRMAKMLETILRSRPLPQSLWHLRRNILLPRGSNYVYRHDLVDPANVNHTIEYTLFIGDRIDRQLKNKVQLFAQMIHEPTFDQLRTKEQLGYVVFSGCRASTVSVYMRFLVQSERDPEYLDGRIEAHLTRYRQELEKMTDSEFESHRRSLINQKEESDKNLGSETGRLDDTIGSEYFDFFKTELDVAELKKLTKKDMQDFYREFIDPYSKTRAKLSVHMFAQGKAKQEAKFSPEQQQEAILDAVSKFFSTSGINFEPETLKSKLAEIDVLHGNQEGLLDLAKHHAVSSVAADRVDAIVEQLKTAIPSLFLALGIASSTAEQEQQVDGLEQNGATNGHTEKTPPILIENVDAWKAGQKVSEGPRALNDLSQFEDLDSKL